MQPQKSEKIDLNIEYACPCRRRGKLIPIVLTEAFGCNHCQKIFVVEDNGYILSELSTNYPYKRTWRWKGNNWHIIHSQLTNTYLPISLSIILLLIIISASLALRLVSGFGMIAWVIVSMLLVILLTLMVWLIYRR